MTVRWEPAFVAVSALLDEPREAAIDAIGDGGALQAAEIVRALRSSSREVRARAIAAVVAQIATEIDAAGAP